MIKVIKDDEPLEVEKIQLGDVEVSEEDLNKWKEAETKLSDYEKSFSQRMEELATKEKNIEPMLELQEYLLAHPEQATKITDILEGKEPEVKKEEQKHTDSKDPNAEFKKELDDVKNILTEQQKAQKEEKEAQDKKDAEVKILEAQKFLQSETDKLQKEYLFLAPEVLLARLLNTKGIDNLPTEKLAKLMDTEAKSIHETIKSRAEEQHKVYIEEKKKEAAKNKTEGKPGAMTHGGKEEPTHHLDDGSTRAEAVRRLRELMANSD